MTKQQKTYFLLAAAIFVWSIVGYLLYQKRNPSYNIELTNSNSKKYVPNQFSKKETYTIKGDYRDPFLGKLPPRKTTKKKSKKVLKKTATAFPNVIYNGTVEGGRTKSYTITVNGKQEILKIGGSIDDVKLLRANDKQATVRFNGETKTIQLQ